MTKRKNIDLLVWNFDFALSTFYEIESRQVEKLLPPRIIPMEVAHGVALINITAFNFPEGGLGKLPEFQELILSIIVLPDLSRDVPKFAMHVISLSSTCQEHLDHSAEYYKLPSFKKLSYGKIDKENINVEYGDSDGKILTMQNCNSQANYRNEERYFQTFTTKNEVIYVADIYIKAKLFDHQKSGYTGKLFNHPFFKQLEVEYVEPVSYLQMIAAPNVLGQEIYYRPKKFI